MSASIFVFCLLLQYIKIFADGLLFNENIDLFQNTDIFDSTTDLVSNANPIDKSSDLFDPSLDADFDLFASDIDLNPTADFTLVADCGPPINDFQGKKARLRRQTSCPNPNLDLSLPTLDQASKEPWRPTTDEEKKRVGINGGNTFVGGSALRLINFFVHGCLKHNVCSSRSELDIWPVLKEQTYTLINGRESQFPFFLLLPFLGFCFTRGTLFNKRIVLILHHSRPL